MDGIYYEIEQFFKEHHPVSSMMLFRQKLVGFVRQHYSIVERSFCRYFEGEYDQKELRNLAVIVEAIEKEGIRFSLFHSEVRDWDTLTELEKEVFIDWIGKLDGDFSVFIWRAIADCRTRVRGKKYLNAEIGEIPSELMDRVLQDWDQYSFHELGIILSKCSQRIMSDELENIFRFVSLLFLFQKQLSEKDLMPFLEYSVVHLDHLGPATIESVLRMIEICFNRERVVSDNISYYRHCILTKYPNMLYSFRKLPRRGKFNFLLDHRLDQYLQNSRNIRYSLESLVGFLDQDFTNIHTRFLKLQNCFSVAEKMLLPDDVVANFVSAYFQKKDSLSLDDFSQNDIDSSFKSSSHFLDFMMKEDPQQLLENVIRSEEEKLGYPVSVNKILKDYDSIKREYDEKYNEYKKVILSSYPETLKRIYLLCSMKQNDAIQKVETETIAKPPNRLPKCFHESNPQFRLFMKDPETHLLTNSDYAHFIHFSQFQDRKKAVSDILVHQLEMFLIRFWKCLQNMAFYQRFIFIPRINCLKSANGHILLQLYLKRIHRSWTKEISLSMKLLKKMKEKSKSFESLSERSHLIKNSFKESQWFNYSNNQSFYNDFKLLRKESQDCFYQFLHSNLSIDDFPRRIIDYLTSSPIHPLPFFEYSDQYAEKSTRRRYFECFSEVQKSANQRKEQFFAQSTEIVHSIFQKNDIPFHKLEEMKKSHGINISGRRDLFQSLQAFFQVENPYIALNSIEAPKFQRFKLPFRLLQQLLYDYRLISLKNISLIHDYATHPTSLLTMLKYDVDFDRKTDREKTRSFLKKFNETFFVGWNCLEVALYERLCLRIMNMSSWKPKKPTLTEAQRTKLLDKLHHRITILRSELM